MLRLILFFWFDWLYPALLTGNIVPLVLIEDVLFLLLFWLNIFLELRSCLFLWLLDLSLLWLLFIFIWFWSIWPKLLFAVLSMLFLENSFPNPWQWYIYIGDSSNYYLKVFAFPWSLNWSWLSILLQLFPFPKSASLTLECTILMVLPFPLI